MLDNLLTVAIIIIVLWLGAMAFYFYVSRQQRELEEDIEKLREQLDKNEGLDNNEGLDKNPGES